MDTKTDKLRKLSQALRDNLKRRKKSLQKNKKNKSTKNISFKTLALVILVASLLSCSKKLERTGYLVDENALSSIEVNKTSKDEIVHLLGEPTVKSNVDVRTYYYMGRQYEQVAFFPPKLKEQRIIAIKFDAANIVSSIKTYDKNYAQSLPYDSNHVVLKDNKIGIFEQMFTNLGKFNSKAQRGYN